MRLLQLSGTLASTPGTWATVVRLLGSGVLDLDPIVTHRFPLDRYAEAFALMNDRAGLVAKIVLQHAAE